MVSPGGGAACLLLAITIAGCGNPPVSHPSASPGASADYSSNSVALSTPPALTEGEQPLTCGSELTFPAEALLGEPGAETADDPVAEALRRLLAETGPPPEGGGPWFAERPGWRLVVWSEESAQFLLPAMPDEGHAFWSVEFHLADSSWEFVRSGQCDVRPWFESLLPARWELPLDERPGPESRTVRVLVLEQICPSGESLPGPIVQAAVTYLEDSVIVVLGNRTPEGPQIGCGPLTPAEFFVELSEPLGDRQLFDGYVFPPEPRGAL